MRCLTWLGVCALAALSVGCATPDPAAAFREVEQTVAARSGQQVLWQSDEAQRASARTLTDALLSQPLSADNAARLALLNNPGLQASWAELGLAEAQATQSMLLSNPFLHSTVFNPRNGGGRGLDIGISWDVLNVFTLSLRQAAADDARAAARLKAAAETLQLAARTRAAWYAYMADVEGEDWLGQMAETAELTAEINQRLVQAGNLPPLAQADSQAQRLESRFALDDARAAKADSARRLYQLLGGVDVARLKFPDYLPRLPDDDPVAKSDIEAQHLELAQLHAEMARAEKQAASITRTAWTNTLEVGWSWDREPTGEWKDGPSMGIALPLFDTGNTLRTAARFDKDRLDARLTQRRQALMQEAQHWTMRMQRARQRVEQLRETLLPLLSEVQDAALLEYNAMQKSPAQLLGLKRRELAAVHQLVQSLNDYWQARNGLEALNMGISLEYEASSGRAAPIAVSGTAGAAGGH